MHIALAVLRADNESQGTVSDGFPAFAARPGRKAGAAVKRKKERKAAERWAKKLEEMTPDERRVFQEAVEQVISIGYTTPRRLFAYYAARLGICGQGDPELLDKLANYLCAEHRLWDHQVQAMTPVQVVNLLRGDLDGKNAERSTPMNLKVLAARLDSMEIRKFKKLATRKWDLRQEGTRQIFTVRLDLMDAATRRKIELGKPTALGQR